jgi:hypothetical protein
MGESRERRKLKFRKDDLSSECGGLKTEECGERDEKQTVKEKGEGKEERRRTTCEIPLSLFSFLSCRTRHASGKP